MTSARASAFALWRRVFAGHPLRIGGLALVLLVGAAVAWYLGSPLFLRTYAEEALPGASAAATQVGGADARVIAVGELGFVDPVHNGKGPVRLVAVGSRRFVRFENVAIQNGPDLHVYLSPDTGGKYTDATSLYLGPLKATNGSFNYELPPTVDLARYRSVVVWCRAFSVLFTWADLKEQ
ncbi:MAG: DM13 domain-containing protein [Chloroflexota bacterium]|nr:DM13 domain-containing protein [Chloroflexota bacterium]